MHTLEAKIRAANAAGRPALIPFLTAHFPDRERFWNALDELDAGGADIIEIGVPFSDPVADGPVVEEASRRVLEAGFHLGELLEELAARSEGRGARRAGEAGLVLMGYLNPFLSYGLERLAKDAARARVSGCIIPDLPHEEAAPVRAALRATGIALIPLVGPNTSEERMALCAGDGEGYVYVVSVMGVTGERAALAPRVAGTMGPAPPASPLPLALGFGLSLYLIH
ncbi:MAG: tryptophan synthase subunit alpha, partial [Desulfovibrio sp.]|nr:tryptophan synthase subunit alpha [Desulfovibrio sp.]